MGRVKLFETPDSLYEVFKEYRDSVKSNPRRRTVFVGKDGEQKEEPLERPLTYEGFLNYCFDFYSDAHHYFENTDSRYDEYREVCSRIRRKIRQDQIEGGMVGQYNPSITQRLNGLVDKSEHEIKAEPRIFNIDK